MPKLPVVSGHLAIKAFSKTGYHVIRKKGSHFRLHHPRKKPLTITEHKALGKGLLRKLLRDAEISVEQFIELL
ncbi:MAG: type II toxin-antitoxin system HicA family toxin [bacterium]|nr:type II toxin-antitoxin system HicA family toxin [bacterium]